jgi:hypothetical protein
MKTTAFAIALLIGSAAAAQVATTQVTPLPDAMAGQSDIVPPITTTVQTDPAANAAATPTMVAPDNRAPERDARGIAVVSDPATAPAGFNQTPGVPAAMGGPFVEAPADALATRPASEPYPACSRTVTDNCVQAYERGRAPR